MNTIDTPPPTDACLAPTALIDSDHPAVVAFARELGELVARFRH